MKNASTARNDDASPEPIRRQRAPFACVPEQLLFDTSVSPLGVRVYGVLDRHAGPGGIYPGRERLAVLCGCSVPSVDRALADLKRAGWLTVKRRGQGATNEYFVADRTTSDSSPVMTQDPPDLSPVMSLESSPVMTKREEVEREKDSSAPSAPTETQWDPDVIRLCELLADLYGELGNTRPNPNQKRWRTDCRLLLTKDGPDGTGWSAQQVETIIRWALADSFWCTNIRSMPKLRAQFDVLRGNRNRELLKNQQTGGQTETADWMNRSAWKDSE